MLSLFKTETNHIISASLTRYEEESKYYKICLTCAVIILFLQSAISATATALALAEKGNHIPATVLSGLNTGLSTILTWMKKNNLLEKESIRASRFQHVIDFIESRDLLNSNPPQSDDTIHLFNEKAQEMFDEANDFMAADPTTFEYRMWRTFAYSESTSNPI